MIKNMKKDICVCIAESLGCMPETNIYFNWKKNKKTERQVNDDTSAVAVNGSFPQAHLMPWK